MVYNGSYQMVSIQYPGYLQTAQRTSKSYSLKWFLPDGFDSISTIFEDYGKDIKLSGFQMVSQLMVSVQYTGY